MVKKSLQKIYLTFQLNIFYHYQPTKFKNSKKKLCIPLFKGYFFVFGKPTSPFFNQKDQVEGKAIYFCAFV